jgi:7-cyano-7-deazaguanine synthase in queuosine biosynthesis
MIAVLFSGGIDSWAALNWAVDKFVPNQVVPIYFDFKQAAAMQEIEVATKLSSSLGLELRVLRLSGLFENHLTGHVPLRNLMMILNTALIEDCHGVVFGMLKGEASEDKNPKFVARVQALIDSQFRESPYRKESKRFRIYTPFANMTKAQVIRSQGFTQEDINNTKSCYSPVGNCGSCLGCLNRWVALELNGLEEPYKMGHPFIHLIRHFEGSERLSINDSKLPPSVLWERRSKYWEVFKAMDKYCKREYGVGFIKHWIDSAIV